MHGHLRRGSHRRACALGGQLGELAALPAALPCVERPARGLRTDNGTGKSGLGVRDRIINKKTVFQKTVPRELDMNQVSSFAAALRVFKILKIKRKSSLGWGNPPKG